MPAPPPRLNKLNVKVDELLFVMVNEKLFGNARLLDTSNVFHY